jgi:DNA-binding beta-propeller fold protein YncE
VVAGVLVVGLPGPASAGDPLTFVGSIGLPRLNAPEAVAADASGDVYVADRNTLNQYTDDRLVKYSGDGVLLDVLAGPGTGTGQIADPSAIAVAPSGAIYVLEKYATSYNRVQEFDALGNWITAWGDYGTGNGEFKKPEAIAVDSTGDVYVADTLNNRVQKFTSAGGIITGSWPVSITAPKGVAVDSSDVIYVAGNGKISRFDATGSPLTSWDVPAATGVAIDGSDNVWVTVGTAIQEFDNLGTPIGTYGTGELQTAESITVAASGKVYVAEPGTGLPFPGRIQRLSSGGTTEMEWGMYPGVGVPDVPTGLAVDASDNVYFTKLETDEIQKFDKDGNLLDEFGGSGNLPGQLDGASALAIGPDGNLYVADTNNQRIQKLDTSGNPLTQWGSVGSADGQVQDPAGIAVNQSTGNVYVSDTGNNRVEEFSASGTFIQKWGGTGTSADGDLKAPKGLWIDGSGNVWVADSGNRRIQEFSSTGIFLAKFGSSGSGPGDLNGPSDVAIDDDGTVWVVDKGNNRIERFTTSGTYLSQLGSLGLETTQFTAPMAIDVDSAGRILVTDAGNDRVQVYEDKNGPDTIVSSNVGDPTPLSSVTFTLSANEPGVVSFHCKLDGGSYASCGTTKSYSGLAEGVHTFTAYATDSHGFDGNPTSYQWTIDATPPVASITAQPNDPTASTSASFTFSSNEPNSKFQYYKDSGSWGPATPTSSTSVTYSSLANGLHTFHVRAIDKAGNVGPGATFSWTINTTPPTIVIDTGPTGYVQSNNADFTFHANVPATFQCQLDLGGWGACTSPKSYSGLGAGGHTFYVKATDTLGNVSSAVHQSWTVDMSTHRPDEQIATGTTYVGNDVYNSTGTNQTKTLKVKVGKTATFKIRIENDGSDPDPYTVTGGATGKGYSVSYYSGTTNITSKVIGGTYKVTLDPGASIVIKMTVKVGSNAVTSRSLLVKTSADHETSKSDAVKAVVKRV